MKSPGTLDGNEACFPALARPTTRRCVVRPVVDAAGRTWPSTSAAARAYRLTTAGVRYRALNGVAGWHFPAGPGRNPR